MFVLFYEFLLRCDVNKVSFLFGVEVLFEINKVLLNELNLGDSNSLKVYLDLFAFVGVVDSNDFMPLICYVLQF
jgi:hypothetical protein